MLSGKSPFTEFVWRTKLSDSCGHLLATPYVRRSCGSELNRNSGLTDADTR